MKSILTLKLVLITFTLGILNQTRGQNAYAEDFDLLENWSGGAAGSYNEKIYINEIPPQDDGFTSDNAVRESTNSISGYAWRLKNEGNPFFLYECSESISSFSVYLAHWNLNIPMDISIEYSVNTGVTWELIATFDSDWWISQGMGDKEYQGFLSGDLNILPEEGEKIHIRLSTNGNERLLIDNFQLLYNNGSAGVQDPLDFVAATASESQINLIFVPNNVNDDVVIVFDEEGSFEDPSGPPPVTGQPFAGGTLLYSGTDSPQIHSGLIPEQTIFYKAWSYDGENYSSGLMDQATTSESTAIPNAWINEIHYDNDGSDLDELIEVVIENVESYALQHIEVYLYNGSNGEVYATETADNFEAGSTSENFSFYTWYFTGIQNGAPEGVALAYNGVLISGQFLSYEGDFMAADGPAAGSISTDIGVQEPTANPVGYSLQLAGSGIQYEHFIWMEPAEHTPGAVNTMQEIGNFTFWTGATDENWEDETNWTAGVPTSTGNASVPDVSSFSNNYPVITGFAEVFNLVIDPGALLEIEAQGALTVFNSLLNSGILNIQSDASGTGSIIESSGVYANVERYITPEFWHYIASPIAELYSDVFEGWYLMDWDEPSESWNSIEDLGIPLNPGIHGYSVWSNSSPTVTFAGQLNAGPLAIDLSHTEGTTNTDNDPSGYNLVGNPYASSIDWDKEDGAGWSRTNMALSIYYWNGTQYASYVKGGPNPGPNGGSNIIPPHQGFFVKCTETAGGSMAVNNEARVHGSQPFYKDTQNVGAFFRVKLTGNQLSDELLIQVNENSSPGFDNSFDALKLYGCEEAPQVYTFGSDNSKLSINTFPGIQENLAVPLGYRSGSGGIHELILDEISETDTIPLFLEDLYEQCVIDFKLTGSYVFFSGPGNFDDRFRFLFSEEAVQGSQISMLPDTPFVFAKRCAIVVILNENYKGRIVISDMYGREVVSMVLPDSDRLEIGMNERYGFYIVQLISEDGFYTRKVYIPR